MIRVIDQANKERFGRSLDQMFRLRHACFVAERGWREFDRDGVYEQDQFDDRHAVYLVKLDGNADVIACVRFRPTTQPHMFSEVFPDTIDGEVPRDDALIEMSRLAIAPQRRGGRIYHEMLLGMIEYGVSRGFRGTTALVRQIRLPIVQATGFVPVPLGPAQMIDGDPVVAVMFAFSDAVLAEVRRRTGISQPVLEREPGDVATVLRKSA